MGILDERGIFDPSLANSLNYTERKMPTAVLAKNCLTLKKHEIITISIDLLIYSLCLLPWFFLHIYTIQIKRLVLLSINRNKIRDFLPFVFLPEAYS